MDTVLPVLLVALVMMTTEMLAPGRVFAMVSSWRRRAIVLNLFQAISVFIGAYTWERWLPQSTAFDLVDYSLTFQVMLGYFAITFIYYWWHRARHEVPALWRWLHQIHHSPAKLEILTSFYKHPLEILTNSLLSFVILNCLLGLSPEAMGLSILITGFAELFYHWNVKTPRWLGYLIQRPESHCVHHQRGVHRNNYSDLPLWDMLFGTFDNPRHQPSDCGFDEIRERQLFAMLVGKNVNTRKGVPNET